MARNMFEEFSEFKANPVAFLAKRGFNVPKEVQNDPEQIQNYLLNSGAISQEQFGQAYGQKKQMEQMLNMFQSK